MSSNELHSIARTPQAFGKQAQQGFIGCGINRRGSDFDAQFIALHLANFVERSSRL